MIPEPVTTAQWISKILAETPELQGSHERLSNDPVLSALSQHGRHRDRNGNPISFADWTLLFSSIEYQRIAYDEVGPWHVSTVWIGFDEQLFETIVFQNEPSKSRMLDFTYHESLDERRYRSEADARAGHAELVRECAAMEQLNELLDPRDVGL